MNDHARQVASLFDLVADDYDQHVPFFTAFAEQFVSWLGVDRGLVLDVGSGRGALAEVATERGATVIAIDLSLGMLRHNRVLCCQMDATDLGWRNGAFDCVMGAFSFHLLPDPAGGVREAARTLRPGGQLGIAVPGPPPPDGSAGERVMAILAKYPRTEPSLLPPPLPFDPVASLDAAGLVDIADTSISLHLPVTDGATYLRGELSHGYRAMFESIDPRVRADADAELRAMLDQMAAQDGLFLDRTAQFVQGRLPAGGGGT